MQTSTLLFVLGVAVLVACASAGKEKDTRPSCFKERTDAQKQEKKDLWKKCKEGLSDEDKNKTGKDLGKVIFRCIMKEKKMVNENDEVNGDAMKKKYEECAVNDEYKKALSDLVDKCIAESPKCEKFWKCFIDTGKTDLPCSCRYKGGKKGKKGDKKGSKESSDEKKDEENKQDAEEEIPT